MHDELNTHDRPSFLETNVLKCGGEQTGPKMLSTIQRECCFILTSQFSILCIIYFYVIDHIEECFYN